MKNSFQFFSNKTFFNNFFSNTISSRKKGFTLVEIMLVIAIIGILFAAMSSFNASGNISQTRVQNFANLIADAIRDAHHDTVIGRIPTGMNSVDSREIQIIKTTGENGSVTRRALGSASKEESKYEFPFIDGDKNYKIKEIQVSSQALNNEYENAKILANGNWSSVDILTLTFLPNGKIDTNHNILAYRITLDYKGFERYIYGDAVIWNIMIKNLQ